MHNKPFFKPTAPALFLKYPGAKKIWPFLANDRNASISIDWVLLSILHAVVSWICSLLNLFHDESGTSNLSKENLFIHLQHSSQLKLQNNGNSIMAACNDSSGMASCCMWQQHQHHLPKLLPLSKGVTCLNNATTNRWWFHDGFMMQHQWSIMGQS